MELRHKDVMRNLRTHFEPHIFARGKGYAADEAVGKVQLVPQSTGHMHARARVVGSREYTVDILYEPTRGIFETFTCTCPYDDHCKHAAALGIALIERESAFGNMEREHDIVALAEETRRLFGFGDEVDREDIMELLATVGRIKKNAARKKQEHLPFRETVPRAAWMYVPPAPLKKKKKPPRFSGERYYIELLPWDEWITLRDKRAPYQNANPAALLQKDARLTDNERELLKLAREAHRRDSFSYKERPEQAPFDTGRALTLAAACGVPIRWGAHWETARYLAVKIDMPPLALTLSFDPAYGATYSKKGSPHIVFSFAPGFLEKKAALKASARHLLRVVDTTIELYPMSFRLANMLARTADPYRYDMHRSDGSFPLSSDDLLHINDIMRDAKEATALTTTLPETYTFVEHHNPQKKLIVDFSAEEETLSVKAAVDYECVQAEVADTVSTTAGYGRRQFKRRSELPGTPDTHIFSFADDAIHYAKVDAAMEVSLFKDFFNKGVLPNMRPRVKIKKMPKILDFRSAYWEKLVRHCQKKQCVVAFTRDRFEIPEEAMRTRFSFDIKTDQDWLSFDAAHYLAGERVTLDDIERFLATDSELFRRADGSIFRVTNRTELERLVALLKSFAGREGRFKGKLWSAAELHYVATSSPYYESVRSKEFGDFCNSVLSGKPVKRITFSKAENALLRPYQKRGVEWLYFLRSYGFAGILADDMGLGKTLQTLVVLGRERTEGKPSLVVCPKSIIYNWQAEAEKFTPDIKVGVVDGTSDERTAVIRNAKKYDLLITGYALYHRDAALYKKRKIRFNYCVLDEAQFIKNHATKSARIVKEVDAARRLALTGTPLENNVSELWSMFDFLMPGFLCGQREFAKRFHNPIMKQGDAQALEYLRHKVRCFMLRRSKEEVLTELPAKIIQESYCHLDNAQSVLYQEVRERVKKEVFSKVSKHGFDRSGIHILAGLMKLRQVCDHPHLLLKEGDYASHSSAKLDMFHELVKETIEAKRKVLVFSQFTGMLSILEKELTKKGMPYVSLTGATRRRADVVKRFSEDAAVPVFLISLKAGGVGLNLTAADTVIIFDPWWNPSVERQAIDRAHRIGQNRRVNVYRLITKGTIEEKILALQNKKKRLFDAMVGESKDIFKKLTWEEVKDLFR